MTFRKPQRDLSLNFFV